MIVLKTLAYSLWVSIYLLGCNNNNVEKPQAKPDGYRVSGTVSNNVGSGLRLKNAGETISVTGNNFAFSLQEDGSSYLVSIASQPVAQSCEITNSGGKISGASINNVKVMCTSLPLNFDASISLKQLNFTWNVLPGISHYKIFENPDGVSGFTPLTNSGDISTNSYSHRFGVHLFDQAKARFRLEAYEDQLGTPTLVNFSADLSIIDILNNAIGYLKASNTSAADSFGSSISLSADGNTLAVGAVAEDGGDTGVTAYQVNDCGLALPTNCAINSGAVYVYTRDLSGSWGANPIYIKASNTDATDAFGSSISLSANGNTMAVGAYREDSAATGVGGNPVHDCGSVTETNCAFDSGAVYIYTRNSSGIWSTNIINPIYIKASNTKASDGFGRSISLSADGSMLAVGAAGEGGAATGINGNPVVDCVSAAQATNCAVGSGAVYFYTRGSSGSWRASPTYIKASNTSVNDHFGSSISLSADGDTLAVGASEEDSPAIGINGNQNDNCDPIYGGTICAPNSGAVYVYKRDLSGSWQNNPTYIKANNAEMGDFFGSSVSLSVDGNTMAIGASGEDGAAKGIGGNPVDDCGIFEPINCATNSGAVYLYTRDSSGSWGVDPTYIKNSYYTRVSFSTIGGSINLSADSNTLVMSVYGESSAGTGVGGNPLDDCGSITPTDCVANSGAVHVYTRDASGSWGANPAYIKATNTKSGDFFGASIGLSADGSTLAVGANWEDSAATGIGGNPVDDCESVTSTNCASNSGAVYLY